MNLPLPDELLRPCRYSSEGKELEPPSHWILLKSPYLDMTAHYYDPKTGIMYSATPQSTQFEPCKDILQVVQHHNQYSDQKVPLPGWVSYR